MYRGDEKIIPSIVLMVSAQACDRILVDRCRANSSEFGVDKTAVEQIGTNQTVTASFLPCREQFSGGKVYETC